MFKSFFSRLLPGLLVFGLISSLLADTPQSLQIDSPSPVTETVIAGAKSAAIVIPQGSACLARQAERITAALEKRGLSIPIESDAAYRDLSGLSKNLILLGDRDSNLAIRKLYYLHYTLLDARYPGKAGSVLRSLHNPFGDGFNILLAGGSDETGVNRAVDELIAELSRAPMEEGGLKLGFLQKIHLGEGMAPTASAKDLWLWQDSTGYRQYSGSFGWNLISRNLALYYMTGEERYAKEFLRLAFPDPAAVKELKKEDNEAYEDASDPLGKPYHYRAIMMILYWDLVEESPVFTPEIRLRVTRKFAEQFRRHWPGKGGAYDYSSPLRQTSPAIRLGDRHYLWDAACFYALARYFNKSHPCADVQTALKAAANVFAPFGRRAAIGTGSVYWYNTYLEPAFLYAALSDPLRYENNPVVREYARLLCTISDRTLRSWSDAYSSPFLLNLIASMTGDQAFADLVSDTGQETSAFRLGQSYWPVKPYPRNSFVESAGKITAARFDARAMGWRSDFPPEEVTDFVSWRQTPDASGDYLLVDAKYEAGRIPFHNFAIIGLRLDGHTLLSGYSSQLEICRDGLYASEPSRYAQLTAQTALGDTVAIRGLVHNQNGCRWQRTLLLRKNRFFLAFDEVTALESAKLLEIDNNWRNAAASPLGKLENGEFALGSGPARYVLGCSLPAESEILPAPVLLRSARTVARFTGLRPVSKGETVSFATVLRPRSAEPDGSPSAAQRGNEVALRLPQPALLTHDGDGLLLVEADHVFGLQVTRVPGLLSSKEPVDIDYDRKSGRLAVRNGSAKTIRVTLDGAELECPAGKTAETVLGKAPAPLGAEALASQVAAIFETRGKSAPQPVVAAIPMLKEQWRLAGSEFIGAIEPVSHDGQSCVAIADGKRLIIATPDGKPVHAIERADRIGVLYWWPGPGLLMAGSRDDKLSAFDLDGREVWSHTAEMAPELVATQKFYWFKETVPGVTALQSLKREDGREALFVGGTGTVEILDAQGRLEKRLFQPWGAVDGFAPVPALEGGLPKMLCKRSRGGWPTVYEVAPVADGWEQQGMGRKMMTDLSGTDMGGFGFSTVGRNFMTVARFAPEEPPCIVGDFNGAQNRLMLWSLAGQPLRQVNFGPGALASGVSPGNYGRLSQRTRNVCGLQVADLDGDGRREIVVALRNRYVMAFDGQLRQRFVIRLDASPVLLRMISRGEKPPLTAVGDTGGLVTLIGPSGSVVATARPGGIPTAVAISGGSFLVGNDKGEVVAYSIP